MVATSAMRNGKPTSLTHAGFEHKFILHCRNIQVKKYFFPQVLDSDGTFSIHILKTTLDWRKKIKSMYISGQTSQYYQYKYTLYIQPRHRTVKEK